MSDQQMLDYAHMMQKALRNVVSQALGIVAEHGLYDGHHFYITFDTTHPGVDMPDWLRERFPEEITIVLEHEFWDLVVLPERFSVSLSFGDRPAQLVVPFEAVSRFVDPHAEFGLKFDSPDEEDELEGEIGAMPEDMDLEGEDNEASIDVLPVKPRIAKAEESTKPETDEEPDDEGPNGGGAGDVVSLDSFRKKR